MKIVAVAITATLIATAAVAAPAHAEHDSRRHGHRQYQPQNHWRNVAVVQATGPSGTVVLDRRAGRIDDLRLDVNRGVVNVRNVVVTFGDGSTYTAWVNQRLGAGNSHLVPIPGPARRVARVELVYGNNPRGFWPRMFGGGGSRGQIAVLASS